MATIPALSAKDCGPSAIMTCNVVTPSTICTISSPFGWRSQTLFAGKFAGEDGAVTVGRQLREGPLPLGCGCLRGTPPQRRQLGQLRLEIEDGDHFLLSLAMT